MRIGQDLCIALVLAVVSVGAGKPAVARTQAGDGLSAVEDAMASKGLSDTEIASVRRLIAEAQECESAGDEDGAISAMTKASAILGIG